MVDKVESGGVSPIPQEKPTRRMSRRTLLRGGTIGAAGLAAAGALKIIDRFIPEGKTASDVEAQIPSVPIPTSTEKGVEGMPTELSPLTADRLMQAAPEIDWTKFGDQSYPSQLFFGEEITPFNVTSDPVKVLKVILAYAENLGIEGKINVKDLTPNLNLEVARVSIEGLPNGQDYEAALNASPKKLIIRKGAYMAVLGTFVTPETGARAVVVFDDFGRTPDNSPRLFLGVLPISLRQQEEGKTSLVEILAQNSASYDQATNAINLPNGERVTLSKIDSDLARKILDAAGAYFVDIDPLKKNSDGTRPLHPNPIVPNPDRSIVGDTYGGVTQLEDGRVVALDSDGKTPIARAIYHRNNQWGWTKKEVFVKDYSTRELFDALDLKFTCPIYSSLGGRRNLPNIINDPEYTEITRNIINEIIIGGELQLWRVFGRFTANDWRRVIENWTAIKTQLDNGNVPDGFSYNWSEAQRVIAFAQKYNMPLRMQSLLWGNDVPDSIVNGNFSSEDLEKILEFTTKSRMLEFKGQISQWVGVSEAVNSMLYGQGKWRFWYDRLGGNEIVFKIYQWAHEAYPEARLILVEDHILENTFLRPRQLDAFMALLRELKSRNIPVDGIGIENNFWIYDPPNKQHMLEILQRIKELGFEIETPETTVAISDVYPSWPSRPRVLRDVGDPLAAQAKIYRETLEAYLKAGALGFGIGDWGDRYSWHIDTGHPEAEAMIFDKNNQPKPAYLALLEVSKAHLLKLPGYNHTMPQD